MQPVQNRGGVFDDDGGLDAPVLLHVAQRVAVSGSYFEDVQVPSARDALLLLFMLGRTELRVEVPLDGRALRLNYGEVVEVVNGMRGRLRRWFQDMADISILLL